MERPDARAFAEAGRAFDDPLPEAAVDNGRFLTTPCGRRAPDALLEDGRARIKGYLEDYAMVDAVLVSYEATFDPRWLGEPRPLAEAVLGLFWDAERGGFLDTGADHEALIVRPRKSSTMRCPRRLRRRSTCSSA